jgi:hypothetical protein
MADGKGASELSAQGKGAFVSRSGEPEIGARDISREARTAIKKRKKHKKRKKPKKASWKRSIM